MAGRLTRVREQMAARGLDALVVYGHTGVGTSVGQVNVQYLAGYAAVVETYLVVPADGEMTLLLAVPYHIPNALELSCVSDMRWGDALGNTIVRLQELHVADGRIGIVGPGAVSHVGPTLFTEANGRLRDALPGAVLETATGWFDDIRLIKSDEELAVLRAAGRWTDVAHQAVFELTHDGARPRDIRRSLDAIAARAGATMPFAHFGAIPMRSPAGFYPDFYPVDRPIAAPSLMMTEFALGFGNYFAKLWGSYFVGEPSDEYRRLFDVAAEVHGTLERGLRPGLTGRDVNEFLAPIEAHGFEQPANVLVGGWSAMNHPPQMGAMGSSLSAPFTTPFLETALQPRQTVTIQAWLAIPGTYRGLWVGSSGAITDRGYESFNRYPVGELRIAATEASPLISFFNVRGRVVELTDDEIGVRVDNGTVTRMDLAPDWSVQVMAATTVEALEPGRFVGAVVVGEAGEAGGEQVVEVHMFEPGVRMGEGRQSWDRPFGSSMVQGELMAIDTTVTPGRLVIRAGESDHTFAVGDGVPAVRIDNVGREHIRPGVDTFVLAWPQADGRVRVDAAATGDGGNLPPL